MTYHDLVQIYFDRANALQSLWTLYVVIIAVMLAFSSLRKERDRVVTAIVSVLFVLFAYRNLDGIHEVLEQRQAALQAVLAMPDAALGGSGQAGGQRRAFEATLDPSDYSGTRAFHITGDVLAVLGLWAIEWRRRRYAEAAAAAAAAARSELAVR